MNRIIKNKTCISITKTNISSTFTENIYISHNVDLIKITSIGGTVLDGANLSDKIFYIKSNLFSQNTHDNIIGFFATQSYKINTSSKETKLTNNRVSGTYNFEIFGLSLGNISTLNGFDIYINLEFIEYETS